MLTAKGELCTYCDRPMVDGGAPLPGEGRAPDDRACATCHSRFHAGLSLVSASAAVHHCQHGVSFDLECQACDDEIFDEGIDG